MLPKYTKDGIDRYVDAGYPVGSFLFAVLTNNLFEAFGKADEDNQLNLIDICRYIHNYTPSSCWGSFEKVQDWKNLHKENPQKAEQMASFDREKRANYHSEIPQTKLIENSITVWADGTYKLWNKFDAHYAANDDNWLVNIQLNPARPGII